MQMMLFSANQRDVTLKAEIQNQGDLDLIQCINGDERRFLQIILNFMSNALKFTDKGGSITLSIKILDI